MRILSATHEGALWFPRSIRTDYVMQFWGDATLTIGTTIGTTLTTMEAREHVL